MKKLLLAAVCVLALGPLAATVAASPFTLGIGDDYYLGSGNPAVGNQAMEMQYINTFIGLPLSGSAWLARPPAGPANDSLVSRSDNFFAYLPVVTSGIKYDTSLQPEAGFTNPSWYYVLGKYGNEAHVWVVGGLNDTFYLPASVTGSGGLSHYSFYGPVGVPDGGTTLTLLGGALFGLAALRRKFNG